MATDDWRRARRLLGLCIPLFVIPRGLQGQDAFRVPSPSPSMAAGPVRIPFEVYHGDIRFSCELNGRAVHMLLDDGFMWDELLLWGPDVDSLGLEYTGELPPYPTNDSTPPGPPSRIAEGISLRLPGTELTDQIAVVSPAGSWYERAFEGSVGQVSGSFFKNFTVGIDFDSMLITLIPPDQFEYEGSGKAIPWEPMGFGPWSVPVALEFPDGRILEMPVLMDLGYNSQLQIVTGGEHDLAMPDPTLVTRMDRGAGQETFHLGRLPAVEIAGYQFKDVLASFLPPDHNSLVFAEVMLGLGLLSRFNVIYDYSRRRMILEPNAAFGQRFEHSMTGFATRRRGDGMLEVTWVYPDSPAQEAGVEEGDVISQVNGRPASDYDADELRDLWREQGAVAILRVLRQGQEHDLRVRLRPLVQ